MLHALQIYSTPVTLRHLEISQPLAHSSARLGKHQPKHLCHHDSPRVVLPSVVLFRWIWNISHFWAESNHTWKSALLLVLSSSPWTSVKLDVCLSPVQSISGSLAATSLGNTLLTCLVEGNPELDNQMPTHLHTPCLESGNPELGDLPSHLSDAFQSMYLCFNVRFPNPRIFWETFQDFPNPSKYWESYRYVPSYFQVEFQQWINTNSQS